MGSSMSVTVANLLMEEIEERALSTFSPTPRFWKRYVDDPCTAIQSDSISHFHDHLNSINANIQFTYETEKDGSLPFLDILLSHDPDGSVRTSVYWKPTHTDQYLQFSSHHPLSHKMAVVRTLFVRAGSLSTSLVERSMEERHIVDALGSNAYPVRFIRRAVKSRGRTHQDTNDSPERMVTLPYIQGLSDSIKRILGELDVRVCFRPARTLRQILVRPKNPVPAHLKNGIVYKVPCKVVRRHMWASLEGRWNAD